jgi:hypothetical protein
VFDGQNAMGEAKATFHNQRNSCAAATSHVPKNSPLPGCLVQSLHAKGSQQPMGVGQPMLLDNWRNCWRLEGHRLVSTRRARAIFNRALLPLKRLFAGMALEGDVVGQESASDDPSVGSSAQR